MALGAKRRIPAPTASAETKLKTGAVKVQKNGDRMYGQKRDSQKCQKYVKHVDKKLLIYDAIYVSYNVIQFVQLSILFTNYYADSRTLPKANVGIQQHDESDPTTAIVFTCILQHVIERKHAEMRIRRSVRDIVRLHSGTVACRYHQWSIVIRRAVSACFHPSLLVQAQYFLITWVKQQRIKTCAWYWDGTKHNQGWGTLLALQSFHCCQTIHANEV